MLPQPTSDWIEYLKKRYSELVEASPVAYLRMVPSNVPTMPGVYVYLITAEIEETEHPYYIGRSKNLRQRLYNNHLMGPLTNARLKKYLIDCGECADLGAAKQFIRSQCIVRWIEEPDIRKRGAIEGYATGLLFPKHGIYEEH